MKITVFGATGNVGSRVVIEAARRGHEVTAVARNNSRTEVLPPGIGLHQGDICSVSDVVSLSTGRDVVVNATRPVSRSEAADGSRKLLDGLAISSVRLIVVGGASSLLIPGSSGRTVLDDPEYLSPEFRQVGEVSMAQYKAFLEEQAVNWAYLSPPASLFPGSRTGHYRLGLDELLVDSEGRSRLSMEDLAVVVLDEAERHRHHRTRFTAAY